MSVNTIEEYGEKGVKVSLLLLKQSPLTSLICYIVNIA